MPSALTNNKGKDIWSLITLDQLATGIASLGDRINELEHESWRLSVETKLPTSLWAQVIDKLKIDHNEKLRHSLYDIWRLNRRDIKNVVKNEIQTLNRDNNIGDVGDIDETKELSLPEGNKPNLLPDPLLPLPQRPITRANQAENVNDDNNQNSIVSEISFVLTPSEWKAAFSRTHQKMNDDWTKIFSDITQKR